MLEAIQNMIYVNSVQSDILVVNYGNLNKLLFSENVIGSHIIPNALFGI